MTIKVNLQNTIDLHKELYLKKARLEQLTRQLNLDLKLVLIGLERLKEDAQLHTGRPKVSIHDTGLLQSLED